MPTSAELLKLVVDQQIKYIDLNFTDIVGRLKNVTVPVSELPQVLDHGIWFDGSSVEGFARIAESDMYLVPDVATFAVLPWLSGEEATARLMCNAYTPTRQPFLGDPRAVLARAVSEAEQMGLVYQTGPEVEFFLLKPHANGGVIPPQPHDQASYFDLPGDDSSGHLRRRMASALTAFGIQVEAMHHEVAHGQHEIDFRYAEALRTADNVLTFRSALKTLAREYGFYATFMPKPIRGLAGNGMHVHQSLLYQNGVNAFADPGDPHGLSKIAKHFIAGQLAHARGMCAVLAPLVNSYKRLVPGYEAPVYISWARVNRSALIRVPRAFTQESTRLELRCPDPSCNPYLAFAVMLAAGLDGIRRELPVPEAAEENLYALEGQRRAAFAMLPGTLEEALEELQQDEVVRAALGPHVLERFLSAKRQEWEDYRLEVTPWEVEQYLEVY